MCNILQTKSFMRIHLGRVGRSPLGLVWFYNGCLGEMMVEHCLQVAGGEQIY